MNDPVKAYGRLALVGLGLLLLIALVGALRAEGVERFTIDFSRRESVRNFALLAARAVPDERIGFNVLRATVIQCMRAHAKALGTTSDKVVAGLAGFFTLPDGRRIYLCFGPAAPDYRIMCGLANMIVEQASGPRFTCAKGARA